MGVWLFSKPGILPHGPNDHRRRSGWRGQSPSVCKDPGYPHLAIKCLDPECPTCPERFWGDTSPKCVTGCCQGLAPTPSGKGISESCTCSPSLPPPLVSLLSLAQHRDFPLGRLNLSNINTTLTKSAQIDPFYCCLQPQAHHVSAERQRGGGTTCCSTSQTQLSLAHGSQRSSRLREGMCT